MKKEITDIDYGGNPDGLVDVTLRVTMGEKNRCSKGRL
jgi:hypothetical protein